MTPVYFPHTLIDRNVAKVLARLFDQTVVYTPMQSIVPSSMERWQSEGTIQIRQPMTGDDSILIQQIEAYRQWGAVHQRKGKLDTALLKLDPDRAPFFDKNATSQIKKDIKSIGSRGAGDEEENAKRDGRAQLNTRLFLCMAQHFDQQTIELANDLQACDDQTRHLLAQLKGESVPLSMATGPTEKSHFDTSGNFMIENRILAWCRLFMEDPLWHETRPSFFWVTHSNEAVTCIRDHCSGLDTKAVMGPLTPETVTDAWKEELKQLIIALSSTPTVPVPESLLRTTVTPTEKAFWLHLYVIERQTGIERTSRTPKLTAFIKDVQARFLDDKPLLIAFISPSA